MLALVLLAAGFYYPDLGAVPLGRGGTGATGTGDLSSVLFNPAGLAELGGLRLQADLSLATQSIDFTRKGRCGPSPCATVSDSYGAFPDTISGVSWEARPGLVLAASINGPPSVGKESFPDPRAVRSPLTGAPQRYSLISSDNLILYPGLSAAVRALSWLDVGVTLQLRYFRTHQLQSIYSVGGIGGDLPDFDAVVDAQASETARLTGGAGLVVRPFEGWSFGLSARPGEPVHATGTLDVTLPAFAAAAGASVTGRAARVDLDLPPQARIGARFQRGAAMFQLDGTWENWGTLGSFTVTPVDLVLHQGGTSRKVPPISIPKRWHAAFSVRGGAEYTPLPWLTVRGGGLFESSAIPDQTLQIDFVNLQRAAATLGATVRYRAFSATAGFAHYFPASRTVTTSQVTRTDPYDAPPFNIGNGSYAAALDIVAFQLAASL